MPLSEGKKQPITGECVRLPVVKAVTAPRKLAEANPDRQGLTVFNNSTATLFLDFGTMTSSATFLVAIAPGGYWESPFLCTEALWGVWNRATGNALIREFV